ncbi:YggS family pyridoxal phosphate-dependent enzyme [Bacteroidota bacterium]
MNTEGYKIVEEKIAESCFKVGRDSSEILLIAVSKNQPVSAIEEAFSLGIRNFGENKAQEFRDKYKLINLNIGWHFIGHLQTNKVKYVVNAVDYIHSVDSFKLADEINRRAKKENKNQKILIEVNTSGESTKQGLFSEKEVISLIEYCYTKENLSVSGLMTMAPFIEDDNILRSFFRNLKILKDKIIKIGFGIEHLSMGMTNDYEIAIEEGATMLRIGTAIFGKQ